MPPLTKGLRKAAAPPEPLTNTDESGDISAVTADAANDILCALLKVEPAVQAMLDDVGALVTLATVGPNVSKVHRRAISVLLSSVSDQMEIINDALSELISGIDL